MLTTQGVMQISLVDSPKENASPPGPVACPDEEPRISMTFAVPSVTSKETRPMPSSGGGGSTASEGICLVGVAGGGSLTEQARPPTTPAPAKSRKRVAARPKGLPSLEHVNIFSPFLRCVGCATEGLGSKHTNQRKSL